MQLYTQAKEEATLAWTLKLATARCMHVKKEVARQRQNKQVNTQLGPCEMVCTRA